MICPAYAVYFDHKRRNDPQFRKQLKKESKKQAKFAKEEAEAHTTRQRHAIQAAVEEAKEEGFPTDVEEKEAYFMQEVARGEGLSGEGMQPFCVWRLAINTLQEQITSRRLFASTRHLRSTHNLPISYRYMTKQASLAHDAYLSIAILVDADSAVIHTCFRNRSRAFLLYTNSSL